MGKSVTYLKSENVQRQKDRTEIADQTKPKQQTKQKKAAQESRFDKAANAAPQSIGGCSLSLDTVIEDRQERSEHVCGSQGSGHSGAFT